MKNHKEKYFRTILAVISVVATVCLLVTTKNSPVSANTLSYEESAALNGVNQYRIENGLPELKWNSKLSEAAMLKLLDEDFDNYFDHVSPDGQQVWDFIKSCGYDYRFAGENLAIDYENESDAFEAWVNSETHRENIEFEKYSDFGFARLNAEIDGRERVLMVQIFGSRDTIAGRISAIK
jgi:uncharacterized protein YkwD